MFLPTTITKAQVCKIQEIRAWDLSQARRQRKLFLYMNIYIYIAKSKDMGKAVSHAPVGCRCMLGILVVVIK